MCEKKFDLLDELRDITGAFEKEGIDYALVGGLAYSALVRSRATEDIDLLIDPQDWEKVKEILKGFGYEDLSEPMDFESIRMRRLVKLGEGESLMVDFLFADTDDFKAGIKQAIRVGRQNHSYNVAPPEVLIRLKEQRMSDIDKMDIDGLRRLLEDQES